MTSLAGFAHRLVAPILAGGRWYSRTAEKWPFSMGVLTTGLKTSAADIFAQTVVERREDIDWKRHAMFCLFGFGYLGAWQYYLYNNVFVRLCGPITKSLGHVGVSPVKTFLDQGLHHPFMYFPAFYALKGGLENRPLQDSYTAYRTDLWENCKALWSVWVPAQLVNFAIVPRHLRIPYVAGVSFVWTVILSCMRGSMEPEATPPPTPDKHAAQV